MVIDGMRSAVCTAMLVLGAGAALAGIPEQRVRQTVDAVSAVVNDPALQSSSHEQERRERVANVMRESFNFRAMAEESVASHWANLTREQRDRFVGVFAQLFERTYDRLVLRSLGGSTTRYAGESADGGRATVRTVLVRKGGDELPIDYRLRADGGWKIADVVVDGVSLASNFRSQFAKTLHDSSFDGLVQRIEKKLAEND